MTFFSVVIENDLFYMLNWAALSNLQIPYFEYIKNFITAISYARFLLSCVSENFVV